MFSSQWTVKQHVVLREGWKKTFSKGLSVVRGIKTEYKDRNPVPSLYTLIWLIVSSFNFNNNLMILLTNIVQKLRNK